MNKTVILLLCCVSIVFACHASCECAEGTQVCTKCKFQGSEIDSFKRSCPCPKGYYTSSLSPFNCSQLMQFGQNGSQVTVQKPNLCYISQGMQTKNIDVDTTCSYVKENNKGYVKTNVNLDFSQTKLEDDCKSQYVTKIQYQDSDQKTYKDMDSGYLTSGKLGSQTIKIPLIDLDLFSSSNKVDDYLITSILRFAIFIGNEKHYLRMHKFYTIVQVNRTEVETFSIGNDKQENSECNANEECITLKDTDIITSPCSDETCLTPYKKNKYVVGDVFYAQVKLKDEKSKQSLKLVKLLFKDDKNKIYNLTKQTSAKWSETRLILSFKLPVVAENAIIQITVAIKETHRLRGLDDDNNDNSDDDQNNDENTRSIQFISSIGQEDTQNVQEDKTTDSANANTDESSDKQEKSNTDKISFLSISFLLFLMCF